MKILKQDIRNWKGKIEVVPETLDDLWHLWNIIEKGDLVTALTSRIIESGDKERLRSSKERITLKIEIEVEKVDFHKFSESLRVSGRIVGGLDSSGYHTLTIKVGKSLCIAKENWKKHQLERIKKAAESKRPEVVIVTIEEGEAVIGIVRDWGVEEIASIRRSYGKDFGNYRKEFFGEVLSVLEKIKAPYIVLAGPGFTKNDFLNFMKSKGLISSEKVLIEDTSSIGTRGFIEALKRGVLGKVAKDVRLKDEIDHMDKLIEALIKGYAVCGLNDVKKAHEYGSIDILLITDEFLRKEKEKWDIDEFLNEIEQRSGKIFILSSEFEPGRKLMGLGGIAAILRFRIPEFSVNFK